mmetsp:Transcript_23439/g.23637  ORF Transcript_23439/g.23637 Transcript_23439/m.23637 type:complete len:232 (+) Transcript_23439:201-896(+)|eukprot:CAMPEP_0182431268 /NCGR_PEP_ID=MMETSP1167-20130531/47746_1 /TAXON_ID=2988 /ORGANISM="Mallomonas Sp, Strain CCMP3275" /LENGTH=231 /DNA_ID=CAMNT_0024617401 /DNA_START=151 /DNA_END=846 /DNA_ORIENTATION=+
MSKTADDDDDEDMEQLQFKIILIGDGAVGKTSIARRFADDNFTQVYKQTIGVDFFIRRLILQPNKQVALQIWDIGGQSIGSKMITNYIAGAHAILLCYDITNYESFSNLEDWYRLVLRASTDKEKPYCALVGNKNDLKHLSTVNFESHTRFAVENEMASFLMSAKSGDQVRQAFTKVAAALAGVYVSKADLDCGSSVVPAQIVNYTRHDEEVEGGEVPDYQKDGDGKCSIS